MGTYNYGMCPVLPNSKKEKRKVLERQNYLFVYNIIGTSNIKTEFVEKYEGGLHFTVMDVRNFYCCAKFTCGANLIITERMDIMEL